MIECSQCSVPLRCGERGESSERGRHIGLLPNMVPPNCKYIFFFLLGRCWTGAKMGATRSSLKTKRRRLVQLPFVTIGVYGGFNAAGYLCCAFTSTRRCCSCGRCCPLGWGSDALQTPHSSSFRYAPDEQARLKSPGPFQILLRIDCETVPSQIENPEPQDLAERALARFGQFGLRSFRRCVARWLL